VTIHVMTLAERLTSEADRLDPPYLHEFNEKGQRLGHHPHAYLLRQAATELKQADEAAQNWYAASSPYATPTGLMEALLQMRQRIKELGGYLTGSTGAFLALEKDAARYKWLRDWYLREGKRSEIDEIGHIRQTTVLIMDAAIDAKMQIQHPAAPATCTHPEMRRKV